MKIQNYVWFGILIMLYSFPVFPSTNTTHCTTTEHQSTLKLDQPEPLALKINAILLAATYEILTAFTQEAWNGDTTMLINWWQQGIIMKFILDKIKEAYVDYEKKNYHAQKIAELETNKQSFENDAKTWASTVGKYIEASLKEVIDKNVIAQAPTDVYPPMSNAFTVGLKSALLFSSTAAVGAALIKQILKIPMPNTEHQDGPSSFKQFLTSAFLYCIRLLLPVVSAILFYRMGTTLGAGVGKLYKLIMTNTIGLIAPQWFLQLLTPQPLLDAIKRYIEYKIPIDLKYSMPDVFKDLQLQLTSEQQAEAVEHFAAAAGMASVWDDLPLFRTLAQNLGAA